VSYAALSAASPPHGSTSGTLSNKPIVSLACSEAIRLAPAFFAEDVLAYPRGSFALISCLETDNIKHIRNTSFADPANGELIIEVHCSQDLHGVGPLEGAVDNSIGATGTCSHESTLAACRALAATALLAKHWGPADGHPVRRRALASFLLQAGMEARGVVQCIRAVSLSNDMRNWPGGDMRNWPGFVMRSVRAPVRPSAEGRTGVSRAGGSCRRGW
jgi:hypothetical protein